MRPLAALCLVAAVAVAVAAWLCGEQRSAKWEGTGYSFFTPCIAKHYIESLHVSLSLRASRHVTIGELYPVDVAGAGQK